MKTTEEMRVGDGDQPKKPDGKTYKPTRKKTK
jgi:hypothetical protein